MKIAIIGSRNLRVTNLEELIPKECTEIVSGGARGIDTCAAEFAREHGLKLTEFLPDYQRYGRGAPLVRNKLIVEYADVVYAFWDGKSRGTAYTLRYCKEVGKPYQIFKQEEKE